jgi:hypothetical protein
MLNIKEPTRVEARALIIDKLSQDLTGALYLLDKLSTYFN